MHRSTLKIIFCITYSGFLTLSIFDIIYFPLFGRVQFCCLGMFNSLGKPKLRRRQLETVFIEEKKKNSFNCVIKQEVKFLIWEGHKNYHLPVGIP